MAIIQRLMRRQSSRAGGVCIRADLDVSPHDRRKGQRNHCGGGGGASDVASAALPRLRDPMERRNRRAGDTGRDMGGGAGHWQAIRAQID